MDHTKTMRRVQPARDLDRNLQSFAERDQPFFETLRERLAIEVFHDQIIRRVVMADVVKSANVRMTDRRDSASFTLDAGSGTRLFRKLLRQDFNGNRTVQA